VERRDGAAEQRALSAADGVDVDGDAAAARDVVEEEGVERD
jgi:hypothetical protein